MIMRTDFYVIKQKNWHVNSLHVIHEDKVRHEPNNAVNQFNRVLVQY